MNYWQDIVTNALLGTERKAYVVEQAGGAVGEVLKGMARGDNEVLLLDSAAIVALYQQAGQLPAEAKSPPFAPCEADETPACSERAAQHLALMLSGEYRGALDFWLAIMRLARKRVSEMQLPAILNYGLNNKQHRKAILAILGKRGRWLASQNPAWSYAVSDDQSEEFWQSGNAEERSGALGQIRKESAERGRELLEESWKQESPQDRARFLEVLEINLSMEDEPFLEKALDDKRKEVRRAAADLLAGMPESRLCQRMIDRALPLMEYKKGVLQVTLPQECDKAMTRDGIEPSSPYSQANDRLGQKAWLFSQILGAVPVQFWREKWQTTTSNLLLLTDKNEWKHALQLGWFHSAQTFHDEEVAEALLQRLIGSERELFSPIPLLDILPIAKREKVIVEILEAAGEKADNKGTMMALIGKVTHYWSTGFTHKVLEHAHKRIKSSERGWIYALGNWAYHLSPMKALEEIAKWKDELDESDRTYLIQQVEGPLRFRQDIIEALE